MKDIMVKKVHVADDVEESYDAILVELKAAFPELHSTTLDIMAQNVYADCRGQCGSNQINLYTWTILDKVYEIEVDLGKHGDLS